MNKTMHWHKINTLQLHREDGPAIQGPGDYEAWYINGLLHREDGPAITRPDKRKEWWVHGKLHREDGPAITCPDGREEWWVDGKYIEDPRFLEFLLGKKSNT